MMFPGPCEHCPNPDKALWQTECMYRGPYLTHRAFVQSHFDPPCEDEAREKASHSARNSNLFAALLTLGVAALLAFVFIWIKHR